MAQIEVLMQFSFPKISLLFEVLVGQHEVTLYRYWPEVSIQHSFCMSMAGRLGFSELTILPFSEHDWKW